MKPENIQRGGYAEHALAAYSRHIKQSNPNECWGMDDDIIKDLLTDLMHLCKTKGLNVDDCISSAEESFSFEISNTEAL